MTQDEHEQFAAQTSFNFALAQAELYIDEASIHEGAVGILIRALELATPDLSPARRASLMVGE
ncbi:MAG: hypothetical protein KGL39_16870 [Patescibacteria group bacterium]|nr:hypothetical protein [Patescibacteria group bacterium]